jgi:protein disulfide-isomerase A1
MQSAPVLGWIFVQTEAERLHFTNSLKDLAWRYQGRITFGTVDANQFGAASARLGLTYGKWPAFAVENTLDDAVYPLDHQIVMGVLAIEAFVLSLIEDRSIPDVETAQSTADSTRQGNGRTEL